MQTLWVSYPSLSSQLCWEAGGGGNPQWSKGGVSCHLQARLLLQKLLQLRSQLSHLSCLKPRWVVRSLSFLPYRHRPTLTTFIQGYILHVKSKLWSFFSPNQSVITPSRSLPSTNLPCSDHCLWPSLPWSALYGHNQPGPDLHDHILPGKYVPYCPLPCVVRKMFANEWHIHDLINNRSSWSSRALTLILFLGRI